MKAYIIKKEFLTISSSGDLLEVEPTAQEKLMDAIFGTKYIMVELNSKVAVIVGANKREINTQAWLKAEALRITDFEIFLLKH